MSLYPPLHVPGTTLSVVVHGSEQRLRAYPHSLACVLLPPGTCHSPSPVNAMNLEEAPVPPPRALELQLCSCLAPERSGVLLFGPPRAGKSVLVRFCSRRLGLAVRELRLGLGSGFAGEEEKSISRALLADGEVVVVRGIGRVRGTVLGCLLEGMTAATRRARVVVVAESPEEVPTALRRAGRLDREVGVGYPAVEERRAFLERALPGMGDAAALERLARACPGLAYPAILSWIGAAAVRASVAGGGPRMPSEQDLMATLAEVPLLAPLAGGERSSAAGDLAGPSWEDIGGTEEAKSRLREALEGPLRDPERFLRFGVRPARGVLLCGPPGVSKTMLARAAARSAPAALFTCSGASLYSMYFGEAERQLRELFKAARLASPAILFIDELDAVVPARGGDRDMDQDQTSLGLLSTLLNEMDGVGPAEGVLVVAATNRIDLIDQALLRPGRFDSVVHVPLPAEQDRLEILRIATRSMTLDRDVDLQALAEATEGLSGAELVSRVREAAIAAMREYNGAGIISSRHFST